MQWDRDRLLMSLGSFAKLGQNLGLCSELCSELDSQYSAYCDFYDLNLVQKAKASRQDIAWYASGTYFITLQRFIPIAKNSEPPKARVILIHGYFDHVGLYEHLIEFLVARNVEVYAFDLPGHGLSSGARAAIDDFGEYQTVLLDCLKLLSKDEMPLHLIGQSTGAAIIMDFLCSARVRDFRITGVALLAPLVRPVGWKKALFTYSLVKNHKEYWSRKFTNNSEDQEFLAFLRDRDSMQSKFLSIRWIGALKRWIPDFETRSPSAKHILVCQGAEDQTVDYKHNLKVIRKQFSQAKIRMIAGGGHHLVNESYGIRDSVFDGIAQEFGI